MVGLKKIPIPTEKKESKEWDIQFTKNWLKLTEDTMKKHADEYFWIHNRWKYRPQGNDSNIIHIPKGFEGKVV